MYSAEVLRLWAVALCDSGLLEPRTPLTTFRGRCTPFGLWFDKVSRPALAHQSIVPGPALAGQRFRARTGGSWFGLGELPGRSRCIARGHWPAKYYFICHFICFLDFAIYFPRDLHLLDRSPLPTCSTTATTLRPSRTTAGTTSRSRPQSSPAATLASRPSSSPRGAAAKHLRASPSPSSVLPSPGPRAKRVSGSTPPAGGRRKER